jgi:hypothetical protein
MSVWQRATPEQRWNAALAACLSALLLLFGSPSAGTGAAAVLTAPGATPSSAPFVAPSPTAVPSFAPLPLAQLSGHPHITLPTASSPPPPAPGTPLHLAALVGSSRPGGPSDQAVAERFLPDTVIVDMGAADVCALLPTETNLVLAAHDLTPATRKCLRTNGVTALTFDSAGSVGQLLSMRRSLVDSVVDQAPLLTGRIGIVGEAPSSAAIARAAAALGAQGHTVVATALLDPSTATDTAGVVHGVADFAAARVDTVVFAVSVANQSLWVDTSPLPPTFVVADASDSISNESYPAGFDGSTSRTTAKGTWFARTHGATSLQKWCRALVGAVPSSADASSEMRWCALAETVTLLQAKPPSSAPIAQQLRALHLTTPATSDVGAYAGGWGPSALATIVWRKDCSCFVELKAFGTGTS